MAISTLPYIQIAWPEDEFREAPLRAILIFAILAFATNNASLVCAAAQTASWSEIGLLDCRAGVSIGLVMGARQQAKCTLQIYGVNKSTTYFGRLDKVGRATGIPSGSKLVWSVWASSNSGAYDMLGRYQTSSEMSDLSSGGTSVLCKTSSSDVCMKPAVLDNRWKENQASAILVIRLEADTRGRRSSKN